MNHTTRRYPRLLRDAFNDRPESAIGITGPVVIRTQSPAWVKLLRRVDMWLFGIKHRRAIRKMQKQFPSMPRGEPPF